MFLRSEMNENDTTVNTNIVGIRVILYYFMKLGYLEKFKISKMKANKEIIETYSEAEIDILLKKPNLNKCTFIEYRNWVIINFFLGTGCRMATLINITLQDIDFENQLIIYRHTKNRKQQIIPMSNSLKKYLLEYLEFRKINSQDDYLFVNAYGEKLRNCLLSQNLCEYNRARGVIKTGVHRWRHTFSKLWILKGGDIFRLQKILGHSDLEMIKNYVTMFTNDLQMDFDKFNPLEQLTNRKEKMRMK
jgi:integrase/recombinase XerD